MFYKSEVTATDIADIICRANGLSLTQHSTAHNRCRYMAKRALLKNGRKIDARGTFAFPLIEVYRAAIYADLMAIGLDVRSIEAVLEAATRTQGHESEASPSRRGDGFIRSEGGLRDAIRGVAAGERWSLRLRVVQPGHSNSERVDAEFVWDDAQKPSDPTSVDAILGRAPQRLAVHLDLVALFSPLLTIVGKPDAN